MLEKLINLANELDQRGLTKEAGKVDDIMATLTKLVNDLGGVSGDAPEEDAPEEDEQVEFAGESTEYFDMCPGAVKAFKMLREEVKNDGVDEDSIDIALEALGETDELLGMEKEILKEKSATQDELKKALELSHKIAYKAGVLSQKLDSDLSDDFGFLGMHIEAISDHVDNKKIKTI